jgi:hypothetical protein
VRSLVSDILIPVDARRRPHCAAELAPAGAAQRLRTAGAA